MSRTDHFQDDELYRQVAAQWTVRRDRGLSAAESIEYELWLADHPQHRAAMVRAGGAWDRLDRIPDDLARSVFAAQRRRPRWWRVVAMGAGSLGAAAAIALSILPNNPAATVGGPASLSPGALQAVGPRLVSLADGTEVRLNAGSEIVERFSAVERGVELTRGEAHFKVTKDPTRPFVVSAGALSVRAIGTAFNVARRVERTEVLVTEGRVALLTEFGVRTAEDGRVTMEVRGQLGEPGLPQNLVAELGAGERAAVTMPTPGPDPGAPVFVVARVDAAEISRALAWQENLLRLGGATLAEIAAEFERRTGHRVVLADPALADVRLGGRFRADDAEGFAKLLAAMLDVEAERAADGAIVLRKKK